MQVLMGIAKLAKLAKLAKQVKLELIVGEW
jgi:hypothetical protein